MDMPSVLAFPPLAGMSYPRLELRRVMRVVPAPERILASSEPDRAAVRVLMTSASLGCSRELVAALPNLALVVSQGAGLERSDASPRR